MTDQELCDNYKTSITKLAYSLSPDHYDDLVSVGYMALLEANKKFYPTKNVKFSTYAIKEITYDMKDELRKLSWFKYDRNTQDYKMLQWNECSDMEAESNVEEFLLQDEGRTILQGCLDKLKPKEQEVLKLYFWNNMKLIEIASTLRVSIERICQIKQKALKQVLRSVKLKGYAKEDIESLKGE